MNILTDFLHGKMKALHLGAPITQDHQHDKKHTEKRDPDDSTGDHQLFETGEHQVEFQIFEILDGDHPHIKHKETGGQKNETGEILEITTVFKYLPAFE